MSRLLAALRRIEARGDTVGATITVDADHEPRAEKAPAVESSLPTQESSVWPGDIVYDPQAEYPGHWAPQSSDWPAVTQETEAGSADSAPWPDPVFAATSEALIADDQQSENIELTDEGAVEESLACDPVVEEVSSFAEPLEASQGSFGGEPELPAVEDGTATTPPVQIAAIKQTQDLRETSDETADEPLVSVRLPGFGRPNRRGRVEGRDTAAEGFKRPALVPFLPPQQRPYREACESILSALPQHNSVALVLAWTDEDLDHCVLSARLAEVMADRLDDPVLLIDMGPKRRLSTLLQVPAIGSLTEAMVGFVSWRDQIVQTSTAGLCLLPSGPHDFEADPVAVARLIEACKEDFGIVLVVGCALSVVPENVLATCDAAVLLVEAGHTSAAKAAGAIQRLRSSGAEVAGCLLTAAF